MKKIIASVLSLSLLFGPAKTSFAEEISPYTSGHCCPTWTPTEKLELTTEEKAAIESIDIVKKVTDDYIKLSKNNGCLREAVKDIAGFLMRKQRPQQDYSGLTGLIYDYDWQNRHLVNQEKSLVKLYSDKNSIYFGNENMKHDIKTILEKIEANNYLMAVLLQLNQTLCNR